MVPVKQLGFAVTRGLAADRKQCMYKYLAAFKYKGHCTSQSKLDHRPVGHFSLKGEI